MLRDRRLADVERGRRPRERPFTSQCGERPETRFDLHILGYIKCSNYVLDSWYVGSYLPGAARGSVSTTGRRRCTALPRPSESGDRTRRRRPVSYDARRCAPRRATRRSAGTMFGRTVHGLDRRPRRLRAARQRSARPARAPESRRPQRHGATGGRPATREDGRQAVQDRDGRHLHGTRNRPRDHSSDSGGRARRRGSTRCPLATSRSPRTACHAPTRRLWCAGSRPHQWRRRQPRAKAVTRPPDTGFRVGVPITLRPVNTGPAPLIERRRPTSLLPTDDDERHDTTGAPGFEPGIAGPKPAALPLGHAPWRFQV